MTRTHPTIYFAICLGAILLALWTGQNGIQITQGPTDMWTFWIIVLPIIAIISGVLAIMSHLYTPRTQTDPLTSLTPSAPPRGGHSDHLQRPAVARLSGSTHIPRRSAGRSIAGRG